VNSTSTPSFDQYLYFNPALVTSPDHRHLAGVRSYLDFLTMIKRKVILVDRSGTIQSPVKTKVLHQIPVLKPFSKSYEEICDERAIELLLHSDRHDLPIYTFYSGGIDSTLMMISILKYATPKQLARLTVLLTQESIGENLLFYREHIEGKLRQQVAMAYPFLLNKKAMFVCGELNDQLFGSDLMRDLININGAKVIHAKFDRDLFARYWGSSLPNPILVNRFLDLLETHKAACPVPIETNADFLWWINFSLKWQSVFLRMISFTCNFNLPDIDLKFANEHFFCFFGTDDFQLWSMNNNDKKIKDTWASYKFTAKDVIYKFTKDEDYRRNKTKRGSLYWIILHQVQKNFITGDFRLLMDAPFDSWHQPDNSFSSCDSISLAA
jgi:hypothetical protein